MPAEAVMRSSPHLLIMAKKIATIGSPKSSWNNMIGPNVFAKERLNGSYQSGNPWAGTSQKK